MVEDPGGPAAEPFRLLRTNLDFVNLDRRTRVIMVTSAGPGEGKSTTVANLAVALARAGQRVALVDLDLRQPSLDRFFGLEGRPGFTDVALGRVSLDQALVPLVLGERSGLPTESGNGHSVPPRFLAVLPSGPLPPDVGEFATKRVVPEILEELRSRAALVLIDAPPLLQVGDALALSALVDGLLPVARLGELRRGSLAELARLLAATPVDTLGFVVAGTAAEDGYGHGYGYGHGTESKGALPSAPVLEEERVG